MPKPSRRDKMLYQMGIPQWELVHPNTLRGIANMPIAENVQLVLVAEKTLDKAEQFIQDVLCVLDMPSQNCLCLSFDLTTNLNLSHSVIFWFLGANQENITAIQKAFSDCIIWQTPNFEQLLKTASAKKQLWQQIQQGTLC
ncbi:DNA polymerase III subunit psi [Actinobacillus delphinicola]|uniref:DNA polymerase III subunit psi n=1 Tax=Actinobacillus delphinicola TaxID=51161 RepID=A0A448TSN4_9PAST|nr:DNA polymerase III subunit psi [Actinobacillus delphinicola]VEJ08843.1 DNA polymerase III subunit psi [Actinobacillus delphinicola]